MNILLLGATGYLGNNIAYSLSNSGHNVFAVARSKSDISRLIDMNVRIVSSEIGAIELVFRSEYIDWVINGVCTYKQNNTLYGDMLDSNIIFPLTVLNLAVKYNVKNYITIGTSLPETLNLYSFSKHQFSKFGKYLCEKDGINFADLQLEMFFGGLYEPSNRFISLCKVKLKNNEDLELTEGYQKRDLVRVEDVVAIIERLIESNYIIGYKLLPVGSGEQHSIREIMTFMRDCISSSSQLKFGAIESRNNEPDTLADISWYSDIEYKLQYSFFEGLKLEMESNI